jgi:hypothetical protein
VVEVLVGDLVLVKVMADEFLVVDLFLVEVVMDGVVLVVEVVVVGS